MDKIRIGIIGMGRMGITHYSIINTHPAVEMTAIADTSGILLSMIKKYLPGVTMFEDFKDLLKSGLVDAVIVCTPSLLHYDACKMAAEQGIAVFCEKPFTTSPAQAQELADLFEQKGLVNQVGYVYRFDVVFDKVKEMLDQQLIGRVCHANVQFLSSTISKMQPEKGWRSKRENGGGATYEMGSHVFDLLEFFFGKPQRVLGTLMNQVYSEAVEDISEAQLLYEGGVSANVHVNWSDYTYRKPMLKLDFHGTKGKIQADLYGLRVFLREENKEFGLPEGWTSTPMNMLPDPCPFYVRGTSFTNQLYAFADAVLANKKSTGCSFREAAETQELIHTIFENNEK
jgi:predicted dehydrogenase